MCKLSRCMCPSTYNRLWDRARYWSKIVNFFVPPLHSTPPLGGSRRINATEWCGKSLNRHISVKNYPISIKFGTLQQVLNPIAVTWPKLKFLKFKMAAIGILKIAFLAITHRPIVRFWRHFVWGSRMACRQTPHDEKLQIFKIQDGGRAPFWKLLNHPISAKVFLDFDKIWCSTAYNKNYWTWFFQKRYRSILDVIR